MKHFPACFILLALVLLIPTAEAWSIYSRPVGDVMWAIGRSQPKMGKGTRRSYAETILREGGKRKFDSFTLVAMCHNESRWNVRLVGGAGRKCHGACQHCVQFKYKYCRGDKYDSPRCKAKRSWLLVGNNNITETASDITNWRKLCRKVTGKSALFHRWLHGFQGYGRPKARPKVLCGMVRGKRGWRDVKRPRQVNQVMNYRRKLIRLNSRRRR